MNRMLIVFVVAVFLLAGAWFVWVMLGDAPPTSPPPSVAVQQPPEASPAPARAPEPSATPPQVAATAPDAASTPPPQQPRGRGVIRGIVEPVPQVTLDGVVVSLTPVTWKTEPTRADLAEEHPPLAEFAVEADGAFRFERLAPGEYHLAAKSPTAIGTHSATLDVRQMEVEVTIALRKAAAISGFVVTATGEPVADAAVYPTHRRAPPNLDSLRTLPLNRVVQERVRTDAEGAFVLAGMGGGTLKLCAVKDGYAPTYSEEIDMGTEDVTIVLREGGDVLGQVVEKDSARPVPDATLTIQGETPLDSAKTTTGGEGNFFLVGLAAGKYTAAVEHDTMVVDSSTSTFEVVDGRETSGVRIEMLAGATIGGRIYDQDTGLGIANARIMAGRADSRRAESADSALDGTFTFAKLEAGTYSIFYDASGYPRPRSSGPGGDVRQVSVEVGETRTDVEIALSKGLLVSGRVVDAEGSPIAGARVSGRSRYGDDYQYSEATTADGRFEVAGLRPAADLYLQASKDGFAASPVGPLTLGEESLTDVEIVMQPEASISGIVVDTAGKPVPKANIIARRQTTAPFGTPINDADAQGKFTIKGLTPGTYKIVVSPAGNHSFGSDSTAATVELAAGEDVTDLRITLNAGEGLTISGRVTDEAGKPIQRAYLNANSMQGGGSYGNAQTDANGQYEIASLKDAVYRVEVHHPQHTRKTAEDVAAGTRNLDFVLGKRGSVEGRVLAASTRQPITDFFIYHTAGTQRLEPWMRDAFRGVHDAEGRFALNDVEAGDATVHVQARGYAPASQHVGNLVGGGTVSGVEILLEPGVQVEGTVVNSSGTPVAGAQVFLGEAPMYNRGQSALAQTDREGRFTLDTLPGGASRIAVSHPSYAPGYADVNLNAGARGTVQIVLGSGGTVEGMVTSGGTALAGQGVGLYFPSPTGQGFQATAQTDANGWYEFKGLQEGTAQVSASILLTQNRNRSRNQQAEIRDGAVTRVDFDFPVATASIEGYILQDEATQAPVPNVGITLSIQTPGGDEGSFVQSGADGSYAFDNLPAGAATFSVYVPGMSRRSSTVQLGEGQHLRQNIFVGGGAAIACVFAGVPEGYMAGATVFVGDLPMPQTIEEMNSIETRRLMAGMAQVDPSGVARIAGLEAGIYTVFGLIQPQVQDLNSPNLEEIMRLVRFQRAVVTVGDTGESEISFAF